MPKHVQTAQVDHVGREGLLGRRIKLGTLGAAEAAPKVHGWEQQRLAWSQLRPLVLTAGGGGSPGGEHAAQQLLLSVQRRGQQQQ